MFFFNDSQLLVKCINSDLNLIVVTSETNFFNFETRISSNSARRPFLMSLKLLGDKQDKSAYIFEFNKNRFSILFFTPCLEYQFAF